MGTVLAQIEATVMKHLIFDTETTDLISNSLRPIDKQPRIIEFFGLMLDDQKDWEEVSTLHKLLNPGVVIPDVITKITGLDAETIKNAEKFDSFANELAEFINKADVIVAHNLSYDISVVNFEFARIEKKDKLPQWFWPRKKICTVELTEAMKGYRLNLGALHQELFNEPFNGAHRAEHDVRALARCYVELIKRGEA